MGGLPRPRVQHDPQVNRSGAFTETCLAIERAHAAGLRAGATVFLALVPTVPTVIGGAASA